MLRTYSRRDTYSGRWPTSTKATCGDETVEKAAFSRGIAATTSGHQGLLVFGSMEATKEIKNVEFESVGKSRASTSLGRVKDVMIGILRILYILDICKDSIEPGYYYKVDSGRTMKDAINFRSVNGNFRGQMPLLLKMGPPFNCPPPPNQW